MPSRPPRPRATDGPRVGLPVASVARARRVARHAVAAETVGRRPVDEEAVVAEVGADLEGPDLPGPVPDVEAPDVGLADAVLEVVRRDVDVVKPALVVEAPTPLLVAVVVPPVPPEVAAPRVERQVTAAPPLVGPEIVNDTPVQVPLVFRFVDAPGPPGRSPSPPRRFTSGRRQALPPRRAPPSFTGQSSTPPSSTGASPLVRSPVPVGGSSGRPPTLETSSLVLQQFSTNGAPYLQPIPLVHILLPNKLSFAPQWVRNSSSTYMHGYTYVNKIYNLYCTKLLSGGAK